MGPNSEMLGPTHGGDDDDDESEDIEEKPKINLAMKNLDSDNNVRDIVNEIILLYKKAEQEGNVNDVVNQLKSIDLKWHKKAIFQLVRSSLSNKSSYYSVFDISFEEFVKYMLMLYIDKGWDDDLNLIIDEGELDPKIVSAVGNGFSEILSSKKLPKTYSEYIQTALKSMLKNPNRMLLGLYYIRFVESRSLLENLKRFLLLILPGSSVRIEGIILQILAKMIDDNEVSNIFINKLESEKGISKLDILKYLLKNKIGFSKVKDKFNPVLSDIYKDKESKDENVKMYAKKLLEIK